MGALTWRSRFAVCLCVARETRRAGRRQCARVSAAMHASRRRCVVFLTPRPGQHGRVGCQPRVAHPTLRLLPAVPVPAVHGHAMPAALVRVASAANADLPGSLPSNHAAGAIQRFRQPSKVSPFQKRCNVRQETNFFVFPAGNFVALFLRVRWFVM